jgi:hypothetical protein
VTTNAIVSQQGGSVKTTFAAHQPSGLFLVLWV